MKRVLLLTILLLFGLALSQIVPAVFGEMPQWFLLARQFFTMGFLAFIMIEVGREFEIDLNNKRQYAVDYFVAATAATFPWIFVTVYFVMFLMPEHLDSKTAWIEALLAGRFAAPTSAGVLFSMLASAGLAGTWAFKKTRILAIFDDLDTVILMIPLKMLMVGIAWQLGGILIAIAVMLALGWKYYKQLGWPTSWKWILAYSFAITLVSEVIYFFTKDPVTNIGLHLEVLLPAFLLGCALKPHHHGDEGPTIIPGEDPPGMSSEERAGLVVSSCFLFLVGFSLPSFTGEAALSSGMSAGLLFWHVIIVTILANLGKTVAIFFYRNEASLKQRLAVSISMCPRGEVGAGVLAVSLSYGITGPFVTVGFLSLALNLVLTGGFIWIVKQLLAPDSGAAHPSRQSLIGIP